MTDSSGALLGINRYDEYGKPQSTNSGRFQYTGQMWFAELGLYFYKARFYAPHLGRFMQTDPAGTDGGINLYAYVLNDPVNGRDPTGLQCGAVTGSFIQHCDDDLVFALQDVGHLGASLTTVTMTFGGTAATGGGRGGAIDASVTSDILSSATTHDYIVGPFDVCSGSGCAEAIHETFPSYVVPNLGQSVSDQQISPVYLFPDSGFSIGHVQTLFYDNGFSARNITQPDHWLCCGTVDIINWSTPSGWKVAAYGTGSNYFRVGWANEAFGPAVFKGLLGSYISVVRARVNLLGGIR